MKNKKLVLFVILVLVTAVGSQSLHSVYAVDNSTSSSTPTSPVISSNIPLNKTDMKQKMMEHKIMKEDQMKKFKSMMDDRMGKYNATMNGLMMKHKYAMDDRMGKYHTALGVLKANKTK